MYKHILLLLDCSSYDNTILEHVGKLAIFHNSHIHLYHAVHAHTIDQQRILLEKSEKCLIEAMNMLKDKGVDVDYSYSEGEPEDEVINEINKKKWDLIAMATHGHRFIGDAIFGSISDRVKHHTNIPILLIRGDENK